MEGPKTTTMKFCDTCHNMLYLKLEDGSLHHHCRNCMTTTAANTESSDASCVVNNNYVDDFHKQYISPYIAYDPTLPRTSTIECINKACQRPSGKPQDVIYVKYDTANMKFLYYCCYCGMFWKTS